MQKPHTRKTLRLPGYNYSQAGCYFITVCVKNRQELLGKVVGDGVLDVPYCKLSETGKVVAQQIQVMSTLYADKRIDAYVVMPNHIHLMLSLIGQKGSSRTPTPTNAAIPSFVSTLKRYTNRSTGLSLWQRSYHDHIIRNEAEYLHIWQYIDENPAKWQEDIYYVEVTTTCL